MTTEKLTAKQANIKISKLLKGIDNSSTQISKHQSLIEDAVPELQKLLVGLANSPVQPAKSNGQKPVAKPAAKPAAKSAAAKPVAKSAKKTPTKAPAKAVKIDPKPAAKPKAGKPKPPVSGRPSLKQAIQNVMSNGSGPMSAADIWKAATGQYGYWSRQSLYNALKDEKLFSRNDDKFSLLAKAKSDAKAEEFVATVAADPSISKVV